LSATAFAAEKAKLLFAHATKFSKLYMGSNNIPKNSESLFLIFGSIVCSFLFSFKFNSFFRSAVRSHPFANGV
jgi:hypothetical protein